MATASEKAAKTQSSGRGRPAGSKNRPKRFTAADSFQTLTAEDLGLTHEDAQGVAVKLTGRTVERSEAQQSMDAAVLAAWDEYVAAGKPADVPGSRIVKFIPLSTEADWTELDDAGRQEINTDAKELGAMIYSAGTYLKKSNGLPILPHVHGIRHVPQRDPQWVVLAYSVAEKVKTADGTEG